MWAVTVQGACALKVKMLSEGRESQALTMQECQQLERG
jgi:hypothetical protein